MLSTKKTSKTRRTNMGPDEDEREDADVQVDFPPDGHDEETLID